MNEQPVREVWDEAFYLLINSSAARKRNRGSQNQFTIHLFQREWLEHLNSLIIPLKLSFPRPRENNSLNSFCSSPLHCSLLSYPQINRPKSLCLQMEKEVRGVAWKFQTKRGNKNIHPPLHFFKTCLNL